MPSVQELLPLVAEPREDLSVEHKGWLDLGSNEHRATIAKAAIALVNHGGGFIVIGLADHGQELQSTAKPADIPEITQDAVNAAIRRYATPEFHCEMYNVPHPVSGVVHPVIALPGTLTEPVMSKRDCPGVIAQNRCYIRKPGPRSEEPQTGEEWRTLLHRCVRAGRDDMLDAIRSIVSGRVELQRPLPNAVDELRAYCEASYSRFQQVVANEPDASPSRFPHGYYELGFSLVGVQPARTLVELQDRLSYARRIKLTGWTPFLELGTQGWAPYPYDDFVEAWIGRPVRDDWMSRDPSLCDFWRASRDGKLYTIRGYAEDSLERRSPGTLFDINLPIWRVGEGMLFASRLAEQFDDVEAIAVRCRYAGISDRGLTSVTGHRIVFGDHVSSTNEILLTGQATPAQIQDNLAEFLHQLLSPLYERFNFFQLPITLVEEELARMRGGRF